MFDLSISLVLGGVAGLANLFGGAIVSARAWSRTFLAYFIALGSGFMLATAVTEMIPEVNKMRGPKIALAVATRMGMVIVLKWRFAA